MRLGYRIWRNFWYWIWAWDVFYDEMDEYYDKHSAWEKKLDQYLVSAGRWGMVIILSVVIIIMGNRLWN